MTESAAAHDSHHHHHITSVPALLATFGALVFLTVLTVALSRVDMGRLDMVVTLGIATVKAALVALIFMQLVWDKLFNTIILLTSLVFLGLFLGSSIIDSRQYHPAVEDYRSDNPPPPLTFEGTEAEGATSDVDH